MTIGRRIALLRKKAGMTQEQLADLLGSTRQAVSKWESGKSTPDVDCVIRICTHFQVTTDYLLLGTDSENRIPQPLSETAQELPKTDYRRWRNRFIWTLVVCGVVLVMLPFLSSLYQVFMRQFGPYYSNPNDYLYEYPLCLLLWGAVIGAFTGLFGIVWASGKEHHS